MADGLGKVITTRQNWMTSSTQAGYSIIHYYAKFCPFDTIAAVLWNKNYGINLKRVLAMRCNQGLLPFHITVFHDNIGGLEAFIDYFIADVTAATAQE